jgi:hypothetical protein
MSDPSRFSHARWPSTGASRISSPAARSPAQPQVANSSPPSAQFAALPTTASAQLGAIAQQVSYAVPMHSQGIHLTACGNACMNMLCDFYSKPDQIKPLPSIIAQPTGMTTDHIIAEMTSRGFIPSSVPLSHSTRQGGLTADALREVLQRSGPLLASTPTHFFVIRAISGNTVHINDPLWFKSQYTIDELNRILDLTDPDVLLKFRAQ